MNIKFLKTATGVSIGLALFFTPAFAFATDKNVLINEDIITTGIELSPKITIYTVNGIEEYTANNTETFKEFLSKHSLDAKNLKDLDGKRINVDEQIVKSQSFIKSNLETENELITLKFPEKTVETDELYIGEERVKVEGVDGKALKTTFLSFDPESIEQVNDEAEVKESTITILEAPVEKVIEIGTKELVVEEPIQTNNRYNSSSTSNKETIVYKEAPENPKGNSIVETALKYVGYPYVWAASGPNAFDCSGLVQYVFGLHGISLPRISGDQGRAGTPVSSADAKPGDLVVWGESHIAIYIGNGQIVHAANPGKGVVVGSLYGNYYFSRIS